MSKLKLVVTQVDCNGRGTNPPKLTLMIGDKPLGKISLDNPDNNQALKYVYDPDRVSRTGSLGLYQGGDPHYLGGNIRLDKETADKEYKFDDTEKGDANCKIAINYSILEA